MKGTSIEFGILNKGLDEIYNVNSDLSFEKRKKKDSTCSNKRLYTSILIVFFYEVFFF